MLDQGTAWMVGRAIASVAAELTPEQRDRVATALRELTGNEAERKFFANVALSLEEGRAEDAASV